MNNILLVTPLYPIPYPDNNATDVCHSFAKEWVKLGYSVRVIHFQPVHCFAWHLLIRFFGSKIANMVGGGNFYAKRLRHVEHYVMDGVDIHRIPVFNIIPHGRYPLKSVRHFVDETVKILSEGDFRPDVITGHMMPIEVIPMLNRHFNVRTCNVEHGIPKKIKERYPDYRQIISSYDCYGFRSVSLMERYQREIANVPNPFVCFSGIPNSFVLDDGAGRETNSFLFVGELIERKYPEVLLPALLKSFPEKNFSLVYVGDGPESDKLRSEVLSNDLEGCVTFVGKIARDEIIKYYDSSLCMIMISRGEAFGLVYLEAMARGCLTIASRGEGMDGVIHDGENGFICKAGDVDELSSIITHISSLSKEERKEISTNAVLTASKMTDKAMAKEYADYLLK